MIILHIHSVKPDVEEHEIKLKKHNQLGRKHATASGLFLTSASLFKNDLFLLCNIGTLTSGMDVVPIVFPGLIIYSLKRQSMVEIEISC